MSPSSTRARERLLTRRPKGSAQADVSRLLHPSYATPPSPTSSGTSEQRRRASLPAEAYVDAAGEMHDPDFVPFPLHQRVVDASRAEGWRRHSADFHHSFNRPAWETAAASAYGGGYGYSARSSAYYEPPDMADDAWTFRAHRGSPASGSSDERPLNSSSRNVLSEEPENDDASCVTRVTRKTTRRRLLRKERPAVVDLGEDDETVAAPWWGSEHLHPLEDEPEPLESAPERKIRDGDDV
jgi:hypothetical protein